MFIVATLSFGRTSTAVRVRNLSATGALVESADVPPIGTEIVLRRGTLEAFGNVIWAGSGKAGLAFREPLAVSGWLPEKGPKRPAERDRVAVESTPPARDEALSTATLLLELSAVQAQLGQFGGQLARDTVPVAKYADVQLLAAAEQRIARIIALLLAAEKDRTAVPACLYP